MRAGCGPDRLSVGKSGGRKNAPHGGTPMTPRRRLEALVRLREAGVTTGVLVAPILPGISDSPGQLRALANALAEAGVDSATPIVLHLRPA